MFRVTNLQPLLQPAIHLNHRRCRQQAAGSRQQAASGELAGLRARGGSQSKHSSKASAKDQNVPPRLRTKIDSVKHRLRHASDPLAEYGRAAVDRARGKTNVDIAALDVAHLDAMVEVENLRNPGLNLQHFRNHMEFIEALKAEGPASFRAIIPQTDLDTGLPHEHHVMADVRLRPGEPPSVIVTEPAVIVDDKLGQLHRHNLMLDALEEHGIPLSQVAVIEATAQKSKVDCVMYSLHYAIKAHKNASHFDELHQGLQRGSSPAGLDSRARTSLHVMENPRLRGPALDAHAAFGADVLPADFYKHGASLTQAEQLISRPDGRMAGQVNGPGHDKAENLVERNQAFRVPRERYPGEAGPSDAQFSASIDGFRLQEIERVLAAAAGKPVVPSKSSS